MLGLDPSIHAISTPGVFAWMAGSRPAMTARLRISWIYLCSTLAADPKALRGLCGAVEDASHHPPAERFPCRFKPRSAMSARTRPACPPRSPPPPPSQPASAASRRRWAVREVGDGNLNLVFIVTGPAGGVAVKQALPFVRLVGEPGPCPCRGPISSTWRCRSRRRIAPGLTPAILHYDADLAMIVMELLSRTSSCGAA